jgi:hypothetical protein
MSGVKIIKLKLYDGKIFMAHIMEKAMEFIFGFQFVFDENFHMFGVIHQISGLTFCID